MCTVDTRIVIIKQYLFRLYDSLCSEFFPVFVSFPFFFFAGQKVCWCTTARPAQSIPFTGVKSVRSVPLVFSTFTAVSYISMLEDRIPIWLVVMLQNLTSIKGVTVKHLRLSNTLSSNTHLHGKISVMWGKNYQHTHPPTYKHIYIYINFSLLCRTCQKFHVLFSL